MEEWKVTFNKDNLTLMVAIITLLVAIATLIVSICALKYTCNRDKKHIKSLIKSKQSQLRELERRRQSGFSLSAFDNIGEDISTLKTEIKQLKDEL